MPWAACLQDRPGASRTIEQAEIVAMLKEQSADNPDQIDLEDAIQTMEKVKQIKIRL